MGGHILERDGMLFVKVITIYAGPNTVKSNNNESSMPMW